MVIIHRPRLSDTAAAAAAEAPLAMQPLPALPVNKHLLTGAILFAYRLDIIDTTA